ncbi:MAG TPA: hypothetical protein VGH55_05820, partial [Chthoniobacterales bacterium]
PTKLGAAAYLLSAICSLLFVIAALRPQRLGHVNARFGQASPHPGKCARGRIRFLEPRPTS